MEAKWRAMLLLFVDELLAILIEKTNKMKQKCNDSLCQYRIWN